MHLLKIFAFKLNRPRTPVITVFISVFFAGCASTAQTYMNTPEAELCMNYLTFPSYNIHQSSRAAAIQMRGIDCRSYAGAANARNRANQNFENTLRGIANQQQFQAAPSPSRGTTCNFTRSAVSGMNRLCYYNCLGSGHAVTIGAAEICPITTTR